MKKRVIKELTNKNGTAVTVACCFLYTASRVLYVLMKIGELEAAVTVVQDNEPADHDLAVGQNKGMVIDPEVFGIDHDSLFPAEELYLEIILLSGKLNDASSVRLFCVDIASQRECKIYLCI